ncbi:MAG: hypothetical protein Q9207_008477 [Kuettlingeria erythrocarpa]
MPSALTKIIPFPGDRIDARNPSTLVGLHIKAGSIVGEYWYPYIIQTVEEGAINIELRPPGNFHSLHINEDLEEAIDAATDEKPVEILEAVLGHRIRHVRWPNWVEKEEMRGRVKIEEFDVIGLRLAGMRRIRWIWGEDDEQEFDDAGLYASAYISYGKQSEIWSELIEFE